MVIDFHTHIFPDAIAERAITALSEESGIKPVSGASAVQLKDYMCRSDIDYSVVLNIATNEKQQKNVNDFASSINNDGNIISFGSVYPWAHDVLTELERIKELGLLGIKLHPDYQGFFVDDERIFPIYEKAAQLGLITVFHSGTDIGLPPPVHCTPQRLAKVLPLFGGVPVVAAHFGGYIMWDEVEEYIVGTDIYLDTSFSYSRIPHKQAQSIIKNHGADKVLLGSDYPWSNTQGEMFLIKSMDLTQSECDAIFGGNAQKLLGLI